jgi:prepilin-type N-terminal cleavage/methylation domain-containing protein
VKRIRGLTLVEMLVAMVIVLAVVAASAGFVTRGRAAHRTSESLAQVEEALDAAFALIADDARLAGYLGLAPPGTPVAGASALGTAERADLGVAGACGLSLAHDLGRPLVAVNAAYAAAPATVLACRPSPGGRAAAAADTLVVRHAAAEASRPQAGRLQLETNLRAAVLAADGAASLGAGARWHELEASVFYVSLDSTGRAGWPSLRRKRLVGGMRPAFQDEELVSGITDLQVSLGVDGSDPDASVDRWLEPGVLEPGDSLRALRIEFEAQSDVPDPALAGGNRRKRAARVVELRNVVVPP